MLSYRVMLDVPGELVLYVARLLLARRREIGTVRGRAGLALDNVLIYLTAGFAYGRAEHSIVGTFVANPHDFSATKIGAVAGFGMEYGLDPRWSVKAEALYVELGKNSGIYRGDANSGGFAAASMCRTRCGSCAAVSITSSAADRRARVRASRAA